MRVTFVPSKLNGVIEAPPSKSVAHRAMICSALAGSGILLKGVEASGDIIATARCLSSLGAEVRFEGGNVFVGGIERTSKVSPVVLDCGESGSTLRFLIPVCASLGVDAVFSGSGRLLRRPIGVYGDIFNEKGIAFDVNENRIELRGRLHGGDFTVPGNVSSQFITGFLLAAPLTGEKVTVIAEGKLESAPYVDVTIGVMRDFGVDVTASGNVFTVPAGRKYRRNDNMAIEKDFSNAAYLDAFNYAGGCVSVTGLPDPADSRQGDKVYKALFDDLSTGKTVCISDCPDLGPAAFAVAAICGGGEITGVERLRLKESDRIASMSVEMEKFGVSVTDCGDSVKIVSRGLSAPTEALSSHNDHRVVMALSLLCSVAGGVIDGADAVSKSFPDFFRRIASAGAIINIEE